jgi:hypothetical protein
VVVYRHGDRMPRPRFFELARSLGYRECGLRCIGAGGEVGAPNKPFERPAFPIERHALAVVAPPLNGNVR